MSMRSLKIAQTEWNLSDLFINDNDPQMEVEKEKITKANKDFTNKWKSRDDYLKNPEILREALGEYEYLLRNYSVYGKLGTYFSLRAYQDQNNPVIKAKKSKVEAFYKELSNELQFFSIRIAQIPEKKQQKFLESPYLSEYKHYLERAFEGAKHLLSETEEKIMTLKYSTSYAKWVEMLSGFLSKEEREVLDENSKKSIKAFSEISSLMNSKKKKVRDNAAEVFNDILSKYAEVAEAEINAVLEDKRVDDELRKFERPEASTFLNDDIEAEIVDSLLEAVVPRFKTAQKYYRLKADLLGLKQLAYHERNVEYGEIEKKYTYEEAINLVYKVVSDLDPEFGDILENYVKKGLIDVYPKKGKSGGAFCASYLITQPTYTLLNFTSQFNDVRTIAHELGHGINAELIRKTQNALNFETPYSTAEVASTFMEDFILQELTKEASEEEKLVIMMRKLNDEISSIFRQLACIKFEQEMHKTYREKGYLSKEEIGEIFKKHMFAYMGDAVEASAGCENWWIYWRHIRRFFYNYSYSMGLLISKSLQSSVKKDKNFIIKVKEFLAAGTSDSPKNIFKKLGVDIIDKTFWNKGLDEIDQLLVETESLAKKLGKF